MSLFLSRGLGSKLRFPPLRSSPTSSKNLTRLFLQLPPPYRSFHASPRPQFISAAISTAIYTSHAALVGVHSLTGLPWAYTIPLFAVALRTAIMLPLAIYTRRNNQKQVNLSPLLQSWQHVIQRQTMREFSHLPNVATKTVLTRMRAKRRELWKRWGCGTWKNYLTVLQIPVFLSVMEALREMCGARQGWLGMVSGWADPETTITGDGLVHQVALMVDPSFALEGALWFNNLLLPDPQLVLPFMLSGVILLNIFGNHNKDIVLGKWRLRFMRSMGVAALMVGPIMIHMPSALLVYWISSSLSAYLQALLLDMFIPIQQPTKPCKPKRPFKTGLGQVGKGAPLEEGL